jgi:hypothetical protein
MGAAAATAQQAFPPYVEEQAGPDQTWPFSLSIAENLMDSLLKVQDRQLTSPTMNFQQSARQTLQLYEMALDQYLRELPEVQVSRRARRNWWEAFERRQDYFWNRWQAQVDPLIREDLEALWKDPYIRSVDLTIPMNGLRRIAVDHEFGDLHLLGTAGRDALLHADIRVISSDPQAASQYADAIDIRTTTADSTLRMITAYPPGPPTTIDGVSVAIRLELPDDCRLEIKNAFGHLRIEHFTGGLRAQNRYGDIVLQDCSGDLEVSNRQGAISVTGGRGRLWMESSCQPITVSQFDGDILATNQFADISVNHAGGPVQVETSIGSIRASDIAGPVTVTNHLGQVMVQKVMGDLMLTNTDSRVLIADILGETRIENRRGEIHAGQLGGNVVITNERGDVDLALDQIRERLYRLDSAFGVVRLNLPPNPSALISAETQFGTIDSDFPLEITREGSVQFAKGKFGQGMVTIQLDAKHSNIYLISTGKSVKEVQP